MHELGLLLEVISAVETYAADNSLKEKITSLTLEIGELSSAVPQYLEDLYPKATKETILENTELIIEPVQAIAKCKTCGEEFPLKPNKGICPTCGGKELTLKQGREFQIKQITIEE
jgi:hydrogenase nickel incorporation protein HypA/HybF